MEEATSFFSTITNPEFIIHTGGLILILAIVFAENGVFF